jgi:hypothetical protein
MSLQRFPENSFVYKDRYLYTKPLVQRDPRTSLGLKKAYVWLVFATVLISIITLVGAYVTSKECSGFTNVNAKNFAEALPIFFYVFIVPFIIWCILSLVFAIKWRWMWMTNTYVPARKTGEDIEDIDPGNLSRSGTKIHTHSTKVDSDIQMRIDATYDDLYSRKY